MMTPEIKTARKLVRQALRKIGRNGLCAKFEDGVRAAEVVILLCKGTGEGHHTVAKVRLRDGVFRFTNPCGSVIIFADAREAIEYAIAKVW